LRGACDEAIAHFRGERRESGSGKWEVRDEKREVRDGKWEEILLFLEKGNGIIDPSLIFVIEECKIHS